MGRSPRAVIAKLVALVLLAVIAAALLWGAGEQHYRGCLEQRFVTRAGTGTGGYDWRTLEERSSLEPVSIEGCDRWPF